MPADATDSERQGLLIRGGRIVSTAVIAPLPATIPPLEIQLAAMRAALDNGLANLRAIRDNARQVGTTLVALTGFMPTYTGIDLSRCDLAPFRASVLAMARELHQAAGALRKDVQWRLDTATAKLDYAALIAGDKAQTAVLEAIRTLMDGYFVLLPEFTLGADRLAEWHNAWNARAGLLNHLSRGAPPMRFPVEDWLHGTARVREPLRYLETAMMLGEVLGLPSEPTLTALQFPFRVDDAWLGLRFPDAAANGEPFVVTEDKLLLTGHFVPGTEFDPTRLALTYCGLLLDEWIEVVPSWRERRGLPSTTISRTPRHRR